MVKTTSIERAEFCHRRRHCIRRQDDERAGGYRHPPPGSVTQSTHSPTADEDPAQRTVRSCRSTGLVAQSRP